MKKKNWAFIIGGIFLLSMVVIFFPKEETGKIPLELEHRTATIEIIDEPVESEVEDEEQEVCDCSSNIYNCDDFSTHSEAQSCFEYCGGIDNDIHWLDGDDDGVACEGLGY